MENQTGCMNQLKTVFSQTREFSVECDMILPDYFPEISKLLDCRIVLSEETVTVTGDKISVAGRADIRILYSSDDAELKVYDSVNKYTRIVSGAEFEQGDICFAEQTVTALNYRAVSSRKIEVRASSALRLKVMRLEELSLSANTDNGEIQKRITEDTGVHIHALQCLKFDLEDKISIPQSRVKIGGILRSSVRIVWSEIKATDHKVMLNGTAEITFVYIKEDHSVSTECAVSLPVTAIKEVYGVCEGDICFLNTQKAVLSIDLKNPAVGENEAAIRIQVSALIAAGQEREYTRITDAYALCGELKTQKMNVFMPKRLMQKNDTVDVSGEIPVYDMNVIRIYDNDAADITCAVVQEDGTCRLNGSFNIKVITGVSDNGYFCFSRSCSFEYTISGCAASLYFAEIQPLNLHTEQTPDGKLRYYGKLQLNMIFLQGEDEEIITSLEITEDQPQQKKEQIMLYYGEKGESLWEIAKENHTALETIYAYNQVGDDILKEDQLLVFRV